MKFKIDLFDGYRVGKDKLLGAGIYRIPEDMDEATAEKLVDEKFARRIGERPVVTVPQPEPVTPAPETEAVVEDATVERPADVEPVPEVKPAPQPFRGHQNRRNTPRSGKK